MRQRRQRWAVFVSGRGSNLQALLNEPEHLRVALVVSNSPQAPALLRARRAGVATLVSHPLNWQEIGRALEERGIERIFLAGFMRIIPADFVERWHGRMLNIHPSLLPAYPGLNSIERAFADRADLGVTVHVVTPVVDAGQVVAQARVVGAGQYGDLRFEDVELRVHLKEHHLVRQAVRCWRGPE